MKTTTIANASDDVLTGDSVKMSIDANSIDFLMHNLTNLYSDPVSAVVREYSTNAYDSHVRSGQKHPVQINYDDASNIFTVEDFGVGMSKQEIIDIYSKYGLSTKNNTNTEIGAFGLGAKSALAITDRFDITARQNGTETTAYIQKNSKGVGVVHFVSETQTKQPNGFKISVKSNKFKNVHNFVEMLKGFYLAFPSGSFLVNGSPVESVDSDGWITLQSEGNILGWVKTTVRGLYDEPDCASENIKNKALVYSVGGVIYEHKLPEVISEKFWVLRGAYGRRDWAFIVNVPVGSVDLTPSREALMQTERTEETLTVLTLQLIEKVEELVESKTVNLTVDNMLNFHASLQNVNYWGKTVAYRGEKFEYLLPTENIMPCYVSIFNSNKNNNYTYGSHMRNGRAVSTLFHTCAEEFLIVDKDGTLSEAKTLVRENVEKLAREAFYYVKTSKLGAAYRMFIFPEEYLNAYVPKYLTENRKIYTFDEFISMVGELRTKVRQEAALRRKNGENKQTTANIVLLPFGKVEMGTQTLLQPVDVTVIQKETKVAYIDSNERSILSSIVPVLGWHYNNGGVKITNGWNGNRVKVEKILREALNGWGLIVIPPRRLKSKVEVMLPNMVNAVSIVEKYVAEKVEALRSEMLIPTYAFLNSEIRNSYLLFEKSATIFNIFKENLDGITSETTRGIITLAAKTFKNYDADVAEILNAVKIWGLLPDDIKEQAREYEKSLNIFYSRYPLLENNGITSERDSANISELKKEHIKQYINMVDSLN